MGKAEASPEPAPLPAKEARIIMLTRRNFLAVLSLALLASVPAARAGDDDVPSFKKRGDAEKQFVVKVGTAIVKAARSKPVKIALLSHEYKMNTPKMGRSELHIKMEYHGAITTKRYISDIVVILDTSDKDSWEVLNIRYSDNNPNLIGPSEKKIQEMIKVFNK